MTASNCFEKATEIESMKSRLLYAIALERKVINNERFDKIILAAMKQSNEFYLPKLNEVFL
jgi:16S rRNA (uracil1498-N3)-methyltransferase